MKRRPTITFCSFNSRGHAADRIIYMKKLMDSVDVLLVQEHWYFESDIHLLTEDMPNVQVFGISGMQQSRLLAGRPYGGCAMIVKKKTFHRIEQVMTASSRLCVCICRFANDVSYLLFNAYMPCESRDRDSNDFFHVLLEIRSVIDRFPDVNNVIIGGDLNTDLGRTGSSYADSLRDFCAENHLRLCIEHPRSCVDYTYRNEFTQVNSTIDHFIVSENIMNDLDMYACKKDGDNLSDHDPVTLSLHVPLSVSKSADPKGIFNSQRRAWHRASDQEKLLYKATLCVALSNVHFPRVAIECRHIGCTEHSEMISRYHKQLVEACITAGRESIPSVKNKGRKAGWEEFVAPHQREAIFWNRLWVENGKPDSGWICAIRDSTRREYKRISRWVIRNQEKLKADKMATALLDNRSRDFWSEVKRSKGKQSAVISSVDGVDGAVGVCDVFKEKYDHLYNSVSFDECEMQALMSKVKDMSSSSCAVGICYDDHVITVTDVSKAISKLKVGKSDALEGLYSDHFKNAPIDLHVHIALLLSSMLIHGTSPMDMLLSVLVPIPKNLKKPLHDSNNYRSIAISSLIGKLFDNVILIRHHDKLSSSELQFGFKPGFSTTQCTFVLKEIISSYTSRDSMVNCVLLDASKAFDRVNFIKLFTLLIDRGICPLIAILLLNMYLCQKMLVRWQGERSELFRCTNGVKQGGVLSPVLFCTYMDTLLDQLKRLGVGCHVGHVFAGALSYADDLTLIAPSFNAMRQMLKVCEQFAQSYDVLFNSTKSVNLVFNSHCPNTALFLNEEEIPVKTSAVHLGHIIGVDSDMMNKRKAQSDMYVQSNIIKSRFHFCRYDEKVRLFNSYCSSLYGSSLWNLSNIKDVSICWRKCIRFLFNVSPMTHSTFIPHLVGKIDLQFDLLSRFLKFYLSCVNSPSSPVRLCMFGSLYNYKSPVSDNIRFLISFLNVDEAFLYSGADGANFRKLIKEKWADAFVTDEILNRVHTIVELLKIRNGELESLLLHDEVQSLLLDQCIN